METLLVIAYQSSAPNATMRREMAELMQRRSAEVAMIKAQAMVTDSAIVRGTLTALRWLVHKPFPDRVFGSTHEAARWLEQVSSMANAARILEDIVQTVPGYAVRRESA